MKILILLLLCFSSLTAQELSIPFEQINIHVYNHNKDTIMLTRLNPPEDSRARPILISCDIIRIDSVQIDGKGSKELIFYRRCEGFVNEHGATYGYTENFIARKFEIWNPDTKELLFEAVNGYKLDYDYTSVYSGRSKGKKRYKYGFRVKKDGSISIYNYRDGCGNNGKPDHDEGTYRFIKGRYIKE